MFSRLRDGVIGNTLGSEPKDCRFDPCSLNQDYYERLLDYYETIAGLLFQPIKSLQSYHVGTNHTGNVRYNNWSIVRWLYANKYAGRYKTQISYIALKDNWRYNWPDSMKEVRLEGVSLAYILEEIDRRNSEILTI